MFPTGQHVEQIDDAPAADDLSPVSTLVDRDWELVATNVPVVRRR
ncbi:MAG: hypothetical protein ACLP01_30915 [Solirubrobacteraceae bacterium]